MSDGPISLFDYALYRREAGRARGLLRRTTWEAGELETFTVFSTDHPGSVAYILLDRTGDTTLPTVSVHPPGISPEPYQQAATGKEGWRLVDAWSFEHESLTETCAEIVTAVAAGHEDHALELARKSHATVQDSRSTLTETDGFYDDTPAPA